MKTARTKLQRNKAGRTGAGSARGRNASNGRDFSTGRSTAGSRGTTTRNRPSGFSHAPRSLVAITVLAFILAVGLLSWDLSEDWRTSVPATGFIAVPTSGGISLVDSSNGRYRQLIPNQANASVTAVAWSPDRATLAFTLFHRRPDDRVSSAELFTVPAAGGTPTLLVPRPVPGSIIDMPSWSPDGRSIYYAYQGVEDGKPTARIERVNIADGSRAPVYTNGSFASVAPDGKLLAFVHDDGNGQALRVGSPDGSAAREIVGPSVFQGLMGPRFSPDGAWIAFSATGPGPSGVGETDVSRPRPTGLAAWFTVPVAEAHGDPWGVWKVRPDGSELQRATMLQEDEPLIAWSRDGAWIAVHGTGGLWLVDARGAREPKRLGDGTIGAIDW